MRSRIMRRNGLAKVPDPHTSGGAPEWSRFGGRLVFEEASDGEAPHPPYAPEYRRRGGPDKPRAAGAGS